METKARKLVVAALIVGLSAGAVPTASAQTQEPPVLIAGRTWVQSGGPFTSGDSGGDVVTVSAPGTTVVSVRFDGSETVWADKVVDCIGTVCLWRFSEIPATGVDLGSSRICASLDHAADRIELDGVTSSEGKAYCSSAVPHHEYQG